MSCFTSSRLLCSASVFTLLATSTLCASAQEQTINLQRVVVTGGLLDASLFDTPSSVAVVTDEDIKKNVQHDTAEDVLAEIPNVLIPSRIGTGTIRGQTLEGPNSGVNAFYGGSVPRATVNVDGRYASFNELLFGDTSIWDVKSIEVFRGPQTTSQGANSIAGAMIIRTNDPTFTPEASIQTGLSSNKGRRLSLMASGPLVENELAGRVALDLFRRDSIVNFVNPAFDPGEADPNLSVGNARVKLLWTPTGIPGFEAKLTYNRSQSTGPQSEGLSYPVNGYDSNALAVVSWENRTDTGILDLAYEFENGVKVTNQTQYSQTNVERFYNPASQGAAQIEQSDFSNETRATFEALDGRLTGVAGLFARRTHSDELLQFLGGISFEDEKDSVGAYSEMTYRLTDQWSVTGGLRYQWDSMKRVGSYAGTPVDFDGDFSALLPKVSIAYDITPELTVGALVNRGYNPGGVSLDTTRSTFVPFQDETVWNYELFSRASLLGGDLLLTGNVFYADYRDGHRYSTTYIPEADLNTSLTLNADRSHSYGVEIGGSYAVLDNLRLTGSAGLLRTKVTKFSSSTADFEGNEFAKSPGYMLGLGFEWDINEQWKLGGNVRHTDGYFSDDANTAAFQIDPYTVANMNVSYSPSETVKIFGYVKNIFDERSPTFISGRFTNLSATVVEPRSYGVGMRFDF